MKRCVINMICIGQSSLSATKMSASHEHAARRKDVSDPFQHSQIDRWSRDYGKKKNTHAMAAACKVEINPEIIALRPIRAIRRLRDGASAVSTPIWMPSELRFANPQSAYDAIVNPRFDSASSEAISFSSWMYATNSFSISFVARSSEMRRISERGTPARSIMPGVSISSSDARRGAK